MCVHAHMYAHYDTWRAEDNFLGFSTLFLVFEDLLLFLLLYSLLSI